MTQVRVCDPSAGPGILSHLLEIIHGILFFVVQCWAWVPGYHAISCSVISTEFYPSSGVSHGLLVSLQAPGLRVDTSK